MVGLQMWASGKSMWWNAKESEGRRNLNVTVTATSDMGCIADFDIMKLSQLRITAAPMFGGNWTQGVTCSSTSRQPLVDEVVERKPTRTIPVCVPTMKPKVSQYLLTPRALSPFRHAMTTPRKTLIHWNGFIPNTWCQYTDTASNCRCQYPDV